jgi:serine/threonine protein kinase
LDCVKYIHEENIYHRDIKLENLLFCKETLKVKLCDFGMAERQGEEFVIRLVGTDGYIAPEL